MTEPVTLKDAVALLNSVEPSSVNAIITSPPYIGLPGRGDTIELVAEMLFAAVGALADDGTVTLIVGPSPGHLLLPFEVAAIVACATNGALRLRATYVWDRGGSSSRDVNGQQITHEMILHATRSGNPRLREIATSSVIRTHAPGFNYGLGVTTPWDIATTLVDVFTDPGDLVVDPFAGLAEIGVQALRQGRRFIGGDINPACVELSNQRLAGIA